jgi:hypothetical protein
MGAGDGHLPGQSWRIGGQAIGCARAPAPKQQAKTKYQARQESCHGFHLSGKTRARNKSFLLLFFSTKEECALPLRRGSSFVLQKKQQKDFYVLRRFMEGVIRAPAMV